MDNTLIFLLATGLILVIWNIVLTVLILSLKRKNNQFFTTDKGNVYDLMQSIVLDNKKFNKRSEKVEQGLDHIAEMMKKSFQKIGVIRYNPFHDTGGNMSFSLALLDLDNNGIVLTSIHGRGADRVYAKSIQNGKSQHNLSAEEIESIKKAIE